MTVTPEQLAAYADGELSEIETRRVARAIEGDPALAEQLAADRRLRAALSARFAAVAEAPVPDRFMQLIADGAKVVNFAEARAARVPRRWVPDVRWSGAIAAALIAGVALGNLIPSFAPVQSRDGVLVASADLARRLDTQTSGTAGATRMLITFQDKGGRWCRGFETEALSGIACRDADRWQLERTQAGGTVGAAQYRQAGGSAVMAAAQDMAANAPLDAAAERAVIARGWIAAK